MQHKVRGIYMYVYLDFFKKGVGHLGSFLQKMARGETITENLPIRTLQCCWVNPYWLVMNARQRVQCHINSSTRTFNSNRVDLVLTGLVETEELYWHWRCSEAYIAVPVWKVRKGHAAFNDDGFPVLTTWLYGLNKLMATCNSSGNIVISNYFSLL